jgi:hypothetical protein
MPTPKGLAATGLTSVALLFFIISGSTPGVWKDGDVTVGLWKVCLGNQGCVVNPTGVKCDSNNQPSCSQLGDCTTCNNLNAARAFFLFSVFGAIGAATCTGLVNFKGMENLRLVAAATGFVAGTCGIIVMICEAAVGDGYSGTLNYGFGLNIIALLFSYVAVLVNLMGE